MATSTFYLNRSTLAKAQLSSSNVNFPETVVIVTDDPNPTYDVTQSFTGELGTLVQQGQGNVPGDLNQWGLSFVQGGMFSQGNLRVDLFALHVTNWDPNGKFTVPVSYVAANAPATPSIKVDGTAITFADSELRLANAGAFEMQDVTSTSQNPFWLSEDTRVFQILAGTNQAVGASVPFVTGMPAGAWSAATASAFAHQLILDMASSANADAIFNGLSNNEGTSGLTEFQTSGTTAVYNFAIARIRAVNAGAIDTNARVNFRLCTSLQGNLAFDGSAPSAVLYPTNTTTHTPPPTIPNVPIVGRLAGAPISIPCFAEPRQSTEVAQNDPDNQFLFTKSPIGDPLTKNFYAAAHIDINDPTPRFAENQPLAVLINQAHVCMVVEIMDATEVTPTGATPANSGHLAQRNLSIAYINNPGAVDANVRSIQANFEFVPTAKKAPTDRPNELLFLSKNLPAGTSVEVFMPGWDADKTFHEAPGLRASPPGHPPTHKGVAVASGENRVQFGLSQVARLPINVPAGRYPALITVNFPAVADVGQQYDIDVLQLDPSRNAVVGAFRLHSASVKARAVAVSAFASAEIARARAAYLAKGPWAAILAAQAGFSARKAVSTTAELVHEVGTAGAREVMVIVDRIEVPIDRRTPIMLSAATFEGGVRVGSKAIKIGAGSAGVVTVGEVVFDGPMVDHLAVSIVEQHPTTGPTTRHSRAWVARAGKELIAPSTVAASDSPDPSSWRVWFHVVEKR